MPWRHPENIVLKRRKRGEHCRRKLEAALKSNHNIMKRPLILKFALQMTLDALLARG